MRLYISAALCTLVVLLGIIGYQQKFWQKSTMPLDDEQQGLSEQIVLHFSHVVAEDTPKGQAAIKFAELLEQKSNGQIRVVIYPNGMLYNDEAEFDALLNGDIQMIAPTVSKVSKLDPTFAVLDLPYIFQNDEEVEQVLTGSYGNKLLKQLDQKDMKGIAFWNNGFKQILAKDKLVTDIEDFNGLTVRTMPSKILQMQFSGQNAQTVTTSFDEVYRELENEAIDAQENTISNLYSKGFYQLHKNLTITNHGIMSYAVIMNEDFYHDLSPELQEALMEAMNETSKWNFEHSKKMNEENLSSLKALPDMHIETLTVEQKEKWKAAFQPLHTYYRNKVSDTLYKELQTELSK